MKANDKDRQLAARIFDSMKGETVIPYRTECVKWANTLRRAQLTLHRWAELECGTGDANTTWIIEREGDDQQGRPIMRRVGRNSESSWHIPDREAGALRRVAEVCKASGLHYYHQADPRGCALYVSAEPLNNQNYSSRGIACL